MKNIIFYVFLAAALLATVMGWGDACILLIAGIFVALTVGNPVSSLTSHGAKYLLQASVVLMGFKYDIHSMLAVGSQGVFLSIFSIALVRICGTLFSRWLKVRYEVGALVSCGTSICGGSAIAAIGGVMKSDNKDMAVSLGTIFLLNAVALLIFPVMGHSLHMSEQIFGYWSGIAIQDTSSVAGAAQSYGGATLAYAIPVKLARALWIIPLAMCVGWFHRRRSEALGAEAGSFSIPWFIFLFIIASAVKTWIPAGEFLYTHGADLGVKALVFTLYLIGLGMSYHALKSVGWRALVLGVLLWIVLGISSLIWLTVSPPV